MILFKRISILIIILSITMASPLFAQNLRFDNHRKVQVPEYAVIRIGPFYSNVTFMQIAGYRWTEGNGAGVDFVFRNNRGIIARDGYDFPLISILDARNYLYISEHADLDVSVRAQYEHYPEESQEDDFFVTMPEEGIEGSLSSSFEITPVIKGTIYDRLVMRTDYVDTRGYVDEYGGGRYEYFMNNVGINMDWLFSKKNNLGFNFSRRDNIPFEDEFEDQTYFAYNESVTFERIIFPGLIGGARASFSQTEYTKIDRPLVYIQDYMGYLRGSGGKGGVLPLSSASTLSLGFGYSGAAVRQNQVSNEGLTERQLEREDDSGSLSGNAVLKTELSRTMSHQLSATRSINTGFNSAYEIRSTYGYDLNWKGRFTSLGLFSHFSQVEPSNEFYSDFTDWRNGVTLNYEIMKNVTINASSTYLIRANKTVSAPDLLTDVERVEQSNDYTTWVSRIGTGFMITKKLGFNTYAQHVERDSSNSDITYERDTIAAMFTYQHVF